MYGRGLLNGLLFCPQLGRTRLSSVCMGGNTECYDEEANMPQTRDQPFSHSNRAIMLQKKTPQRTFRLWLFIQTKCIMFTPEVTCFNRFLLNVDTPAKTSQFKPFPACVAADVLSVLQQLQLTCSSTY